MPYFMRCCWVPNSMGKFHTHCAKYSMIAEWNQGTSKVSISVYFIKVLMTVCSTAVEYTGFSTQLKNKSIISIVYM